jgi:RNA polymerase sigma factor (sigma-70 family)
MNFEDLLSSLTPRLKQLALKYRTCCGFSDQEDLFNEMVLVLWKKWRAGELQGKTDSYIVQACYFHLRNYLRNVQDKQYYMSMEEPPGISDDGEQLRLEELVTDRSLSMPQYTEGKALYEKIMNNGLSRREKEVIGYLYDGFTVREIGQMLHISHTMVVKYKQSISRKVSRRYGYLLV